MKKTPVLANTQPHRMFEIKITLQKLTHTLTPASLGARRYERPFEATTLDPGSVWSCIQKELKAFGDGDLTEVMISNRWLSLLIFSGKVTMKRLFMESKAQDNDLLLPIRISKKDLLFRIVEEHDPRLKGKHIQFISEHQ